MFFIQVLKISLIGHRKRILASLGDRLLHEDTPQKPPRAISLRVSESKRADTIQNKIFIRQRKKAQVSSQSISLRELQPPHCCCCCPHPTYYPNLSGRHKMATPLQIPPCRLVLDTNHKDLAFLLPSGLRSNVLIIVSCSLCCWARGGFLLSELNVSRQPGRFCFLLDLFKQSKLSIWELQLCTELQKGEKNPHWDFKKSWNERLNTEKQHIFTSEKFKCQEYVSCSLEWLIDLFKPLFHSIHENSSCNWCKASMT